MSARRQDSPASGLAAPVEREQAVHAAEAEDRRRLVAREHQRHGAGPLAGARMP
jgi:hypothetical protein